MDYSQKTADLIERMCRNIERKDFVLDKEKSEELILKTYDLFNIPRPKNIVWCADIYDKKFEDSASSAWAARSAWSAWSALSALSASSARSARSALSASSASSAWAASSARSARSASSAWAASSAFSAWSALDYDFDWYVYEFEYCQNTDEDKLPNENDRKYLAYCELLMQAKEAGLGYRVEWKDTIYLVPTPIVLIDERNRFHSTKEPAIRWKEGKEFYFLQGVKFEKEWWNKIVKDELSPEEIFAIDNLEHRRIAYQMMDKTKMKQLKDYKVLDEKIDDKGNPMRIVSFTVKGIKEPLKYLNVMCPTTGREYFLGTDKDTCIDAKMSSFGLTKKKFTHEL